MSKQHKVTLQHNLVCNVVKKALMALSLPLSSSDTLTVLPQMCQEHVSIRGLYLLPSCLALFPT